jgi:hypothetical protein
LAVVPGLALLWTSTGQGAQQAGGTSPPGTAPAAATVPARPVRSGGAVDSAERGQTLQPVRPVLDRYCVSCHNDRSRTAGLSLQAIDVNGIPANAEIWEKVIRKVSSGAMPPAGLPRPEPAAAAALVTHLADALDSAAEARPDPGRPLLHRLNRAEYGNAIRDLLAIEVDASTLLPPDDASHGFDNVADNLTVSPALLERYLSAAGKVSALAVGDPQTPVDGVTYLSRPDSQQLDHVEGLPVGTRGGLRIVRYFPLDGEYEISTRLYRTNGGFIRGLVYPHEVEFSVDGERVFLETVGTRADYQAILANPASANSIDDRLKARVRIKAGPRVIGVTFLDRTNAVNPILLRPLRGAGDPVDADGVPRIDSVLVAGPYNPTGPGDTPSRRRVFTCTPANAAGETACARTIVSSLARRAFRRPLQESETNSLMSFYTMGRERRGTFEGGIQLALRRVLADPAFIFRVENDPARVAAGTAYRLSDLELASRLAFFLWSSLPDDELVTVASRGRLRNADELRRQVRRMIADPRADALTKNFAGQWLQLRNLSASSPDPTEFPDFDDPLRQAMRRETELLFEHVMRSDRSVIELLTADYTFLNERLARHYDVPGIYGTRFRRVAVTDEARRGLLGHGSILTVTSYPNRTSPVKRGKWILENLIGSPPPPPPPNVPALPAKDKGKPTSMREQMETHRANPTCATCHRLMDPLGFALENYDATGAWRVRDGRLPIDASAQLADGTSVGGVVDLRKVLLTRPAAFAQTVTQNLMVYATGRGLRAADMPAVRKVLRSAAGVDYQFSALVMGVVESVPFQMRTTLTAAEKQLVARAGTTPSLK